MVCTWVVASMFFGPCLLYCTSMNIAKFRVNMLLLLNETWEDACQVNVDWDQ